MSTSPAQNPHFLEPTRKFIELVKQYPNIWDPNSFRYTHKNARDNSWKEIFRRVDPTYDVMARKEKRALARMLTQRWRNIRFCYIRNSKVSPDKRKDAGNYMFSKYLDFLDGTFNTRNNDNVHTRKNKSSKNIKKGVSVVDNEIANHISLGKDSEIENNYVFEDDDDDDVILIQEDSEMTDEPPRKQLKTAETAESETEERVNNENKDKRVIAILSDIIEQEMDEDRAFFESMLMMVKKLNENSKLEFRIKIMKLIKNLKEMKIANLEAQNIKSESIECHDHY